MKKFACRKWSCMRFCKTASGKSEKVVGRDADKGNWNAKFP
jgi:hypothetical protein